MGTSLGLLLGSIALFLAVQLSTAQLFDPLQPGPAKPTTLDVIKSRGFGVELYSIDSHGHPLTLYRLINPLANPATLNIYPVLYGHGILYDSESMISRSERSKPRKPVLGKPTIIADDLVTGANDYSLPFMFSNNNFDVWLFDSRGVNENNRNLSAYTDLATSQKFWDFSLDDESLIDLPLLIDFVLMKTSSTKVIYVGFSESTFFMFALLSTAPDYADKVAAFIALAPVCYVSHLRGMTVPLLAPILSTVPEFIHYSFVPQTLIDTVDFSMRSVCKNPALSNLICGSMINSIGGKGTGEQTPEFYKDFFKATSLQALKQFLQLHIGKRFGMYDFGFIDNMKRYGRPNPPAYDLSRVRSDRIIIIRGLADFLSTPEDQARLIAELGRKPFLDIALPTYNHFDFIDGRDLIRLVNAPAMRAVYELMYKDGPNILKNQTRTPPAAVKPPVIQLPTIRPPVQPPVVQLPAQPPVVAAPPIVRPQRVNFAGMLPSGPGGVYNQLPPLPPPLPQRNFDAYPDSRFSQPPLIEPNSIQATVASNPMAPEVGPQIATASAPMGNLQTYGPMGAEMIGQ